MQKYYIPLYSKNEKVKNLFIMSSQNNLPETL